MNRECPVENLPQDDKEVRERKELYKEVWKDGELSMDEMDIKYAWYDAVYSAVENKNKSSSK